MASTYTKIASVTVGAGGASSIDFTSIPSTYTDLVVKASLRDTGTSDVRLRFNGNTSSIYTERRVYGNGASTGSDTITQTSMYFGSMSVPTTFTANTFGSMEILIPNYAGSANKSLSTDGVTENNATTSYQTLHAGLFADTTAISSISIFPDSGLFTQYSTATLYGVVNASTAATKKATGGDIIVTSGGYTYHAFLTSGTFTPTQSLSCDVLAVAGGGGGGTANIGGGGGAGGIIYFAGQSVTATGYSVAVGAGGARFTDGTNSTFGALTAAVGGGRGGRSNFGGTYTDWGPRAGGSGGGVGNDGLPGGATTQTGTGATAFYGNAGGSVTTGGNFASGGGAGAAGTTTNSNNAAAGGVGISTYSAWGIATTTGHFVSGSAWFGGGGASGANVDAGGTRITTRANGGGGTSGGGGAADGLPNTGGGGGGSSYSADDGRAGGSGIVIVRYAV
jgi:hypothetical protein